MRSKAASGKLRRSRFSLRKPRTVGAEGLAREELAGDVARRPARELRRDAAVGGGALVDREAAPAREAALEDEGEATLARDRAAARAEEVVAEPRLARLEAHLGGADRAVAGAVVDEGGGSVHQRSLAAPASQRLAVPALVWR